jgi:hypothetical protein
MRNDFLRNQKSVWFFADDSEPGLKSDRPFSGLDSIYADALARDIPLHVMPIGGTSQARKDFTITLEPSDEKLERVIANALAEQRGSYYGRDLTRAVCDFVARCASRLMRYGNAVFEIVFLLDRNTSELQGCHLFEINVRTISFERNRVLQRIPAKVAAERKVSMIIDLDESRLAIFSVPPAFQYLTETKQALAQLGGGALARMYEASQNNNKLGYDAKEHIRAEHLAIAAATRSTGWSANQSLYELFTEYYVLHRRLVFEGFVIALRESILQTLNKAVGKIAEQFGTTAKLKVTGLPTLEDVNRAKEELASGGRTFGSVLDDFSLL